MELADRASFRLQHERYAILKIVQLRGDRVGEADEFRPREGSEDLLGEKQNMPPRLEDRIASDRDSTADVRVALDDDVALIGGPQSHCRFPVELCVKRLRMVNVLVPMLMRPLFSTAPELIA